LLIFFYSLLMLSIFKSNHWRFSIFFKETAGLKHKAWKYTRFSRTYTKRFFQLGSCSALMYFW
jgi:hypothetical protein